MEVVVYDRYYVQGLIVNSVTESDRIINMIWLFRYLNDFSGEILNHTDHFMIAKNLLTSMDKVIKYARKQNVVPETFLNELIRVGNQFLTVTYKNYDYLNPKGHNTLSCNNIEA